MQFYCSPQIILYFSWESLLSNTPNRYFPVSFKDNKSIIFFCSNLPGP